jgi:hypothetical protein|tara:strand:- start:5928 stop:6698 length:771 start_codon:yes stop_codon:yes gene_type:complete
MKNITQSFIKDVFKYNEEKLCGLQIKAKYYDNISFPSSDVQLLGQWFEYKATGQKNRFGIIPEPPKLKSGLYPKKYNDILTHVEPLKKTIENLGYEIIETGTRIKEKGLQGDVDLVLKHVETGKIAFGDIKTTGLINDKWNEYGWDEESLQFKHNLLLQPIHYKLLGLFKYGYEPDFFFFIFSNTNQVDRKTYKINLADGRFEEHLQHVEKVYEIKNKAEINGWKAIPNVKECHNCPLKSTCKSFIDIPKIVDIYY